MMTDAGSPTASNLRTFRFQKKPLPVLSKSPVVLLNPLTPVNPINPEHTVTPVSPVVSARVVAPVVLTPTLPKDTNGVTPNATNLLDATPVVLDNAGGLKELRQTFPRVNPELIEDCLIRAQGNVDRAKTLVREEFTKNCMVQNKDETVTAQLNKKLIIPPSSPSYPTADTPARPLIIPTTHKEYLTNLASKAVSPTPVSSSPNITILKVESLNKLTTSLAPEKVTTNLIPETVAKLPPEPPLTASTTSAIKHYLSGGKKRSLDGDSKETNGIKPKVKRFRRIKKADSDEDYSGGESDHGGYRKQEKRVFDSDEDSDVEVSNIANEEQREVLEFLSDATLAELLLMPQISKKKADVIMSLRPFNGWRDMVEKFQQGKAISTEILNSAQDFLYTRHVVMQLMNKCSKLSAELERTNLTGSLSSLIQPPTILSSELTLPGYQLIGLNWLIALRKKRLNGILADEMGLGKTVQVISFLAWLKESAPQYQELGMSQLIVVPASTLDNWGNELARWCPDLKVTVYYGSQDERRALRVHFFNSGAKDMDVMLTTYNLIAASPQEQKMFRTMKFEYVIFDEAHMLKNMKTKRYEQLSQINAKHRILLTGTPLQNSLLELMSLLTFVMPDMFKDKKEYLRCLFTRTGLKEKGDNENKTEPAEVLPRFEQEQVAQAKKIMKPFVLRRLKKDVLRDLPQKTDLVRNCDMTPRQRIMYDNLIKTYAKSATGERREEIPGMTIMMQLRKVANHPLLVREFFTNGQIPEMARVLVADPDYKEKNLEYVKEDLAILSDFELHSLCNSYARLTRYALKDDAILDSGKFKMLDELLPAMQRDGHRVLIFSQFVIVLNVLAEYMNIRGYKHLRLDGSTPVTVRQELIDEFNGDPTIPVFLLSTRAGGLGINLTAADTVIIHDLDFNPYNDKQAEDRCHRVGQTKPVTVYRFVSNNSIEEDIYQVAKEKLYLEKEISAEDTETADTRKLLKKALGLGVVSSSSPKKS